LKNFTVPFSFPTLGAPPFGAPAFGLLLLGLLFLGLSFLGLSFLGLSFLGLSFLGVALFEGPFFATGDGIDAENGARRPGSNPRACCTPRTSFCCSGVTRDTTVPVWPARPVRPDRCT
jgi:hypothetical protein